MNTWFTESKKKLTVLDLNWQFYIFWMIFDSFDWYVIGSQASQKIDSLVFG